MLKTNYPQTTYNNAAVHAATRDAREENEKNLEKLNKQSELNIINLKNHILQKQTIRAGGRNGGIVKIQMPSFKNIGQIVMEIKVGDEMHSLTFDAVIQ